MTVPFELHVYHHDIFGWCYDVDLKLADGSLYNLDANSEYPSRADAELHGRLFVQKQATMRRSPRQRVDVADLVPLLTAGSVA